MEAGLDNANNPFTNSNGSLKSLDVETDNIHLQKGANDGLLLNLTDNFKANGTEFTQEIFEKSNGTKKSSSDIHFDDDLGPETDVDVVDDAFSPVEKTKTFADCLRKGFNDDNLPKSFHEEVKAFTEGLANNNPLDDDFNPFLSKQISEDSNKEDKTADDFEEHGGDNREETPTPPVDTVHDVGGLEENPAESDSEDEWNYFKGDQAKQETLSSQPETVVETSETEDAMSQLNPNAAEFVPVSPTRSIPSPACRALINDEVIAQSPKRPVPVDIKVPNETEFETEVKSRPSDFDAYSNGHDSDSEHNTSGAEQMDSILNGKNIDDIPEFHPGSTPTKQPAADEFHFGPNAAPFTPKPLDKSEALSTKANYGDDTEQTLNTSFNDSEFAMPPKDLGDPMSMSFSAERGESNPFQDDDDLNKVHDLPENLDEFLAKNSGDGDKENRIFDDTISDLPEHDVLDQVKDNDQAVIQTTDLDKLSQDDEKELASPLEPDQDDLLDVERNVDTASKTPDSNLLEGFVVVPEKLMTDDSNISSLPELEPIPQREIESVSPVPQAVPELSEQRLSPLPGQLDLRSEEVRSTSPQPPQSPALSKSPLPEEGDQFQSESFIPTDQESDNLQEPELSEGKLSPLPGQQEPEKIQPPLESDLLDVDDRQIQKDVGLGDLESQGLACEFTLGTKSPVNFEPFEVSKVFVGELEQASDIIHETEFNPKSEVENINLETKSLDLLLESAASPACEFSAEPAVCTLQQKEIEIPELHSPIDLQEQKQEEEITSSVKDDISSPIEALSPVKSPEPFVEESQPDIIKDHFSAEQGQESSIDEQKVAEIPPQEILSQDLLGDLSCPLPSSQPLVQDYEPSAPLEPSRPTEFSNALDNFASEINEQFSIKTDSIKPEFAETAVITPSEDSKIIDEAPVAPLSEVPVQEPKPQLELTESVQEASKELPNLAPLPIVSVTTPQEAKEVKKEEKKATSTKKPTGKVAPIKSSTAPKTGAAKASPKPTAGSPKTGLAPKVPPKTGTAKPTATTKTATTPSTTAAAKPLPRPKTVPTPKSAEKKPLTNGDVKPSPKTTLTKRPSTESAATKTTARPATTAAPKTTTLTKTTAPRPATAPKTAPLKASATAPKPATGTTTAAAKPRVPLSQRTTSTTATAASKSMTNTTTKTTTTTTTSRTSLSPKTATAPPKPRPIANAAPKPRAPLTKTITKSAADVEKEKKESANKLTASRTTTVTKTASGTATSRTATTTVKKTETKPLSRTVATKTSTTTTTKTTVAKKPGEIKSVTKTKTTKIEKPKENGVPPTNITEEIKEITVIKNVVNENETLLKDNSPLDNKLITESNALIDVNPAD